MPCQTAARRTARARRAAAYCARQARCQERLPWRIRCRSRIGTACRSQYAALHLLAFDGLEQRLEITLAESFVALALDDFEEDRSDAVLREYLQQQTLLGLRVRVDQDLVRAHARHVLAMVRDAHVDHVVVRVRRVEEFHAGLAHRFDR